MLETAAALAGGLGLFLYGIKRVGSSLEKYAGVRISGFIKHQTRTKARGILTGALATVAIQSSSGTIALAISLARARLMTFRQAMTIIIGANIGTTVTAFLVGLNIKALSLPIIFFGGLSYMFIRDRRQAYLAQAVFGFGALFLGLEIMGQAMEPLAASPSFQEILTGFQENPFTGVLAGTGLTAVVQSSTLVISNLQGLFQGGLMTFRSAVPLLLGSNIGTSFTAVLASIGAGKTAQRAAAFMILFNVGGTLLFLFALYGLRLLWPLEFLLTEYLGLSPSLELAVMHLIFNLATGLFFYLFLDGAEKLIKKLITGKKVEDKAEGLSLILEEGSREDLPRKKEQARLGLLALGEAVEAQSRLLLSYLQNMEEGGIEAIRGQEETIDAMELELKAYLEGILEGELEREDRRQLTAYLYSLRDLERMGDLLEQSGENLRDLWGQGPGPEGDREDIRALLQACSKVLAGIPRLFQGAGPGQLLHDREALKGEAERLLGLYNVKEELATDLVLIVADLNRIGGHGMNILRYLKNAGLA